MEKLQHPFDNFDTASESRSKQAERKRMAEFQRFLDTAQLNSSSELERLEAWDVVHDELRQLNETCPYIHQSVRITGPILASYYDALEETDVHEDRCAEGEMMISRGFTVRDMNGDGRTVAGHLFEIPRTRRQSHYNGLVQHTSIYHAFAEYDNIVIESVRTVEDRCAYLEYMTPDLIDELDEYLYGSPNMLTALGSLREHSVSPEQLPSETMQELVGYAAGVIDIEQLPLVEMELHGTRSVYLNDEPFMKVPYDAKDPTGGTIRVAGRVSRLYLSPYASYYDGEIHETTEYHWGACITVEATAEGQEQYIGQSVGTMIADIYNLRSMTL